LRQIARLVLQFGDSKVRTDEQRRMMLAEWTEAFAAHSPTHLHTAVSQAIQTCKFWPSIAEIMEPLRGIRREAVSTLDVIAGTGRWKENYQFEREGRSKAEEVIHRAAQCLKWKGDIRAEFSKGLPAEVETANVRPASTDTVVSATTLNSCAARRARRLPTCGADCSRHSCELRSP